MNIRVIIDKLGPIQNSEIEFKPSWFILVNQDWVRVIRHYCGITFLLL